METNSRQYKHFPFEHRREPLLPRKYFFRRLRFGAIISAIILSVWVLAGVAGYHYIAGLPWVDSFLNSAMIVGGMGPVDLMTSSIAKIFAGLYAIASGAVFLSVFGLFAAPIFHRFLHRFHIELDDKNEPKKASHKYTKNV
jgi:hypothetical protein